MVVRVGFLGREGAGRGRISARVLAARALSPGEHLAVLEERVGVSGGALDFRDKGGEVEVREAGGERVAVRAARNTVLVPELAECVVAPALGLVVPEDSACVGAPRAEVEHARCGRRELVQALLGQPFRVVEWRVGDAARPVDGVAEPELAVRIGTEAP